MKNKQVRYAGIIFLALLGILLVKKVFIKPEVSKSIYKILEVGIDADDIQSIEIKKGRNAGSSLRLEKKDGDWVIPSKWNARVDKLKIDAFISGIISLKGELRSNSKELFSDYGISDDKAFSITAFDREGNEGKTFLVGMKRPGYGTSFMREDGAEDVYLVNEDILPLIGIYGDIEKATIKESDWVDLSVIKFDPHKINSIKSTTYYNGEVISTIYLKKESEKTPEEWMWDGGESFFVIDSGKVKQLLNTIKNFHASELVDPRGTGYGFDKPFVDLVLEGKDSSVTLIAGGRVQGKEQESRYVKTLSGDVYVMKEAILDRLRVGISQFFIRNPLGIDKDKLESLTIRSGKNIFVMDKGLIEKNINYVNTLKRFSVAEMLPGKKYSKGIKLPAEYSLEVKLAGALWTLGVNEERQGSNKEIKYIAQIQGKPEVFSISKDVFEGIFTGLEKLSIKE